MEQVQAPVGLDPESFQRVWRRVMPEDRPDCPFTLEEVPSVPAPAPTPAPVPVPKPAAPCRTADEGFVCLGEGSAAELPRLDALLRQTADHYRICRELARRFRISGLSALAEEARRQAKRLNAARFLIAGTRYTPPPTPVPPFRSAALALRERFQAEQRLKSELLAAAGEIPDPCLAGLYRDLARETGGRARKLWRMVEEL